MENDIGLEAGLLKALSRSENYSAHIDNVDMARLLPNTVTLLNDYKKYYEIHVDCEQINFGEFYTHFANDWHSNMTQHDLDYYRDYVFPTITKIDNTTADASIIGLVKKAANQELSTILLNGFDKEKILDVVERYSSKLDNLKHEVDKDAHLITNIDFEILDKDNGIPWFMPSLQNGLMSLSKGQFVVVSADYGTGKSAFMLSQAVHAVKWLTSRKDSRPVLYFNSEGTEGDVFGRFLSCMYKDKYTEGFEQIVANHKDIVKHYIQHFREDQFMVFQIDCGDMQKIRSKMEQYKPALVIIDITDVLASEEDVKQLKKVYDTLRLLSGQYCPIIGTTQSGDTSYQDPETKEIKTRKWLGAKALYGSKTGKGGAADTIITIGKDDKHQDIRYIATPKKKRGQPVQVTARLIDKFSYYEELAW